MTKGRGWSWSRHRALALAGPEDHFPRGAGHGYAIEAVRELLRYCFQDLGVRRVTANCFLDNASSRRLMERVGMRQQLHAVRESLHRSRRWLDTVGYAILEEEWSPS